MPANTSQITLRMNRTMRAYKHPPDGLKIRLEVLGLSIYDTWLDHFDGHPLRIFVAAWVGVDALIMLVSLLS
jgi:hypothetical protein